MQSRRGLRRGFKLIDLMVGVLVSGVLLALILAWLGHCEAARRAQCWSNMRQVGLALLEYQNANGHYPNAGTFRDPPHVHQGDPLRSSIYRSIVRPGS